MSTVKSLMEAYEILDNAHKMTCTGPRAIWRMLIHAKDYVNNELNELLHEDSENS